MEHIRQILYDYELTPTTWAYLSSLLIIGIYFKFNRFWSMRNLDLIGLISLSPGLLLIYYGLQPQVEAWLVQCGYVWLFVVGALFLIRLLLDPIMVRRPLLEPNLSASGLTFTGAALLMFLIGNVVIPKPASRLEQTLTQHVELAKQGPGYPLFYSFAKHSDHTPTKDGQVESGRSRQAMAQATANRTAAILGQLAIVIGLFVIGYRHFDNIQTGVAVASLYLLLPYAAQMTGRVDHLLPAAFLVWTVGAYRKPILAGVLLGLAAGLIYYPLFLLPLWCSFYWRRGLIRFLIGVSAAMLLLVALLPFTPQDLGSIPEQLRQMFGWRSPLRRPEELSGFWTFYEPVFRLPVLTAFVAFSGSLALWPAQKNLGTLLGCSAAVMLGTQFWVAHQGGLFMAWYLPLLLLTIFRPNLEDRVAITAVPESRLRWRKRPAA